MLEGKEGGGGIPDEMAIAILFSCHHDQDHLNAVPLISRPQRHRVVEKAVSQVIAQFDGELAIPWVRGKFSSSGATVIYLEKPDFTPHTKLYDPNTIAVPLPMALPALVARIAGMTTSSLSPAKAVESAPRAPRGGWWRRRHT